MEEQFPHENGFQITRCKDFKFKELQDDIEPFIRVIVVRPEHKECVIGMEPTAAEVKKFERAFIYLLYTIYYIHMAVL